MAAVIAALLTTWVTFVPSFVFIFLGAPYVERLRGNRSLAAALGGITAAVVGVIANLAVFFALNTLFAETSELSWGPVQLELPVVSSVRWLSVAIGGGGRGAALPAPLVGAADPRRLRAARPRRGCGRPAGRLSRPLTCDTP